MFNYSRSTTGRYLTSGHQVACRKRKTESPTIQAIATLISTWPHDNRGSGGAKVIGKVLRNNMVKYIYQRRVKWLAFSQRNVLVRSNGIRSCGNTGLSEWAPVIRRTNALRPSVRLSVCPPSSSTHPCRTINIGHPQDPRKSFQPSF